jgi:hypothetical protein
MIKRYLLNILIALDQFINALFGGDPDETISSRFGKLPQCSFCRFVCRILNSIHYRHCKEVIEEDEGKDGVF